MLKLAIIGPHKPYPGGISEHTNALGDALSGMARVKRYAYTNIFPASLYPGDYEGDFRGRDDLPEGVDFLLEYNKPSTWRRLKQDLLRDRPDFVLLPWWTFFHALQLGWLARALAKSGIPVIFLCHNICDHDAKLWKQWCCYAALQNASGFITHAKSEAAHLTSKYADKPVLQVTHPVYSNYPAAKETLPQQGQTHFLCLGFIRPYKGVDLLADAFSSDAFKDDHLIVAGQWWSDCAQYREVLEQMENVTVVPKYLTEQEVADYYEWADVAVLPYRKATGSGVAATALHFRKPVVVTRTASLDDLFDEGQTGFIAEPGNPGSLREALIRSKQGVATHAPAMHQALDRLAEELSWEAYARKVLEFGRQLKA